MPEDRLRHPRFAGIRAAKDVRDVARKPHLHRKTLSTTLIVVHYLRSTTNKQSDPDGQPNMVGVVPDSGNPQVLSWVHPGLPDRMPGTRTAPVS